MRLNLRHIASKVALTGVMSIVALGLGGCEAIGFAVASYTENTPAKIDAQYEGLVGQSFTVVVRADRSILADFPGLADNLSIRINENLRQNLHETDGGETTTGYIPPAAQITWLANHPRWRSMMPSELGESLQVTRLVMVELHSFRLHEPGNRFIWNGEAAGTVRVFEIDSVLPDDAVFETQVRVAFPTSSGTSVNDYSTAQVNAVLIQWFTRRASWLMYDHEEKRDIDY